MLIALKETIRRIVRGAYRNINWLDGAIALILLLAGRLSGCPFRHLTSEHDRVP